MARPSAKAPASSAKETGKNPVTAAPAPARNSPSPVTAAPALAHNSPSPVTAAPAPARNGPSHEQIARRAYEIFLARGGQQGNPEQDWFQAERELRLGRQ